MKPDCSPPGLSKAQEAQLLSALEGRLPEIPLTLGYRLGLLFVAGAMVLLPVLYLTLVGGVLFGMWTYATDYLPALVKASSRGREAVIFLFPLVVAGILVVFLVKPFFAPPPRAVRALRLERQREPLLFAFVDRLSQLLGAPIPVAIYLDNEVNAAASLQLRKGRSRGLELTLGAPLVAGVTLAQLAGVLAHELGHFNQRAGMRLSYFIRTVNGWLARLAYQRDAVDAWLLRQCKDPENGLLSMATVWTCRGLIWLTRKILVALTWIGHVISSFQMRQMEFDADRHQVRLVGFEVFAATMEEVQLLAVGHQQGLARLDECWSDGRLPDDLPQLALSYRHKLDHELVTTVRDHLASEKTGFFSTHPATAQRLARARRETGAPVFRSQLPATALCGDFAALSRLVTRAHYCSVLGEAVRPEELISVARTVSQLDRSSSEREALHRFFQGQLGPLRPLVLGGIGPPATPEELAALRDRAAQLRSRRGSSLETYGEAFDALIRSRQAEVLLELRLRFDAKALGLPKRDLAAVLAIQEDAHRKLRTATDALGPLEREDGVRLTRALGLLAVPEVAARVDPDRALREEVPRLLETAILLGSLFETGRELIEERAVLAALASKLEAYPEHDELGQRLREVIKILYEKLAFLATALDGVPYPFAHSYEHMTLADFVVAWPQEDGDLEQLYEATQQTLDRFYEVYFRVAGRLAFIAQQLEEAVGLAPLPEVEGEMEAESRQQDLAVADPPRPEHLALAFARANKGPCYPCLPIGGVYRGRHVGRINSTGSIQRPLDREHPPCPFSSLPASSLLSAFASSSSSPRGGWARSTRRKTWFCGNTSR